MSFRALSTQSAWQLAGQLARPVRRARRGARAPQIDLYIAHCVLGLSMRRLAQVTGVTRAAVRQGIRRIEDSRDVRRGLDAYLTHLEEAAHGQADSPQAASPQPAIPLATSTRIADARPAGRAPGHGARACSRADSPGR